MREVFVGFLPRVNWLLGDNFPSQHIVHHGALTRNEKIEKDKGLPRGRTKGRV